MSNDTTTALQYDRRTVWLHWLTAALVMALWSLGQTIDWFPKGVLRTSARSSHIVVGVALSAVIALRIWWRFGGGGRQLPSAGSGPLDRLATAVHGLLYVLMVATVSLGVMNAWVRGDNIFNLFSIPSFAPENESLQGTIEEWHGLIANTLVIVAACHATAALAHRFLWHDTVLQRMFWHRR